MNFRKNSRGITLIALVITIIVLLILAGVTLNLVTGNNGILGKAKTSVDTTKKSSAKEQVELKIAEFQQEFYEAVYVNNEADVNTKKGKWIADKTKGKDIETEDYKFTITGDNAPYKVTIIQDSTLESAIVGSLSEDGILIWNTLASKIKPENYGDTINYSANGRIGWKIFYNDGTNVYIVLSDYLVHGGSSDTSKIVSGTGMTKTGRYRAYWSSAPSSADTTNHVAKFSPETAETKKCSGNYSTNSNGRCVSTLLDTTLWSAYANGTGGESAIGSPTLNMFVASWNEKYPSDKIYCNNDSAIGYYVGTTTNPTSTSIGYSVMNQKDGYKNTTLYYPKKSAVDSGNCYGYWLASPSAYHPYCVMSVNCDGYVESSYCNRNTLGVRPVVCLKSDIQAEYNTTTEMWEIK